MGKLSKRKQRILMLKNIDSAELERKSNAIIEKLCATEEYLRARTIGVTIARYPEVDTQLFIEAAWKSGKQVVVPRCIPKTRQMDFRLITTFEDLESVYMDLQEPIIEITKSIDKDQIDLQIVPGVVFSEDGYRIGFGGGYYDRYLTDFHGDSISLAFEVQIDEKVPVEKHDIPVGKIITENRVIQSSLLRDKV